MDANKHENVTVLHFGLHFCWIRCWFVGDSVSQEFWDWIETSVKICSYCAPYQDKLLN